MTRGLIVLMLFCGSASAEVIDCAESPGKGDWVYRIIDDSGRHCWFPANGLRRGKEKPREELRWPSSDPPHKPSSEFQDTSGWSHKE
jgi:hypothetical protein